MALEGLVDRPIKIMNEHVRHSFPRAQTEHHNS